MYERSIFGKVKNINSLITELLNAKMQYRQLWSYSFGDSEDLYSVEWPKNIQGLLKQTKVEPNKMRKLKSMT